MRNLLIGDCRELLPSVPAESVHCCVTSPPYWGQRDYGISGQMGLEPTIAAYVHALAVVFREVLRCLRPDGTLWLNLGDVYHTGDNYTAHPTGSRYSRTCINHGHEAADLESAPNRQRQPGLKPKDLCGIPWEAAFALRADGWYLRSEIIWCKPNPMPESVRDRPTRSHEHIFLLTKREKYYYDYAAILERQSESERTRRLLEQQHGMSREYPLVSEERTLQPKKDQTSCARSLSARHALAQRGTRNRRSVWIISTAGAGPEAHPARFPAELARNCILAGCPAGGTVLDPFAGSGTTGIVAEMEGRNSILIELNPLYAAMALRQTNQAGLFCQTP